MVIYEVERALPTVFQFEDVREYCRCNFGSDRCHIRYTTTRSEIFKFVERSYNEWDWCLGANMKYVEY